MLDFMSIAVEHDKKGVVCIAPEFNMETGPELLIQGGDFLAIYNDGLWSKSELTAFKLMDKKLNDYAAKYKEEHPDTPIRVRSLLKAKSGAVDEWHKYVKNQLRDTDPCPQLDSKIIFSNMQPVLEDYSTKIMPYPLSECPTPAYDKISRTLYTDEELRKLEYCIGAIVSGESKYLQKFAVLYGPPGSGKSTMITIIQELFDGHCCVFDAKTVGGKGSFPLESFRSNPLVAIQHDGDLSEVEDNTTINSLVSHEVMPMNVKNKSVYPMRINSFIFMGTNKPVRITDAKSGLIRRLIDISPSGNKLDINEYNNLMKQVKFELSGIAYHCLKVFEADPHYYDNYIATSMISATNDFYNYILYYYMDYKQENSTTLKIAWENYRKYCEYANVSKTLKYSEFREELKSYFEEYKERDVTADGTRVRSLYTGFICDKFENKEQKKPNNKKTCKTMLFNSTSSLFDEVFADCPAQYATKEGTPIQKWSEVTLKLSDVQTNMLHYVKVPKNLIVIDFDIKDENGNKSFELNSEAASKWPLTYAELSKSGAGIHLHYYYDGDPEKLSRVYSKDIEIKVFTGNSSLRRMLTKCNDIPIAHISSGLPIAEKKMISFDGLKNEKALRTCIIQNLQKKNAPGTKPSVDFIFNNLEDAYNSGLKYDVSDMKHDIYMFAASSTNHADYCLRKVAQMKFKSEEASESVDTYSDDNLYFFDVEVFINLFVVVYKKLGCPPIKLINPSPDDISNLIKLKLVGFNCRRYDNHILYARTLGYTNEQLYKLSQRIVSGSSNCFFAEAYNLSYTDIYDFATKKQSLKKYEIELKIHHQELGLKWDEPVPQELWNTVADYCINDVVATEETFKARQGDWTARQILVDICKSMGMNACVNDTTNSLTTKIIFGKERHPALVYTDLATGKQY